jgi:hypothetical protein
MKEGRFSTIRFNEWICISAQYEKAIARIGKQVYQGYSKGLVTDFTSLELCRDIATTFSEARELREELEEELERDALDGLNAEESAKADEVRELTSAQKTKRAVKLKFTKFLGRQSINRALASHRDRVKELSRDLGQRALICFPEEPVLKVRGHKSLCRLANKLEEDAHEKWTEITENKGKGGLSFHTILFGMVADFAKFSKGTQMGRVLLKYFKYDEDEENDKLTQQYAGTNTADALKAQLAEVDEPMLDVGREIDNMQQEYQESPEEWTMTGEESWGASQDEGWQNTTTTEEDWGTSETTVESVDFSPDSGGEDWGAGADEWVPEDAVDDDFLSAVGSDSDPMETEAPPPAAPARATLIRKRPEPDAESWLEPSTPAASSTSTPQIASSMGSTLNSDAPAASSSEDPDDWGWGNAETSSNQISSTTPSVTAEATISDVGPDPFQDALAAESARGPSPTPLKSETEFKSKPTGKKPPFVKSQKEKPLGDWGHEEDGWDAPASSKETSTWDAPASPKPTDTWDTPASPKPTNTWDSPAPETAGNQADDFGWGSPAATSEPKSDPASRPPTDDFDPTLDTMSIDVTKLAEQLRAQGDGSDPLLKLLDIGDSSAAATDQSDPVDLGDDLLPDFLKERVDEEPSEESTFIPELPSFLESEDAPNLEILPFGATPDESASKDDDDLGPFIPEMPE